jgi:hypothetical protein
MGLSHHLALCADGDSASAHPNTIVARMAGGG